MIATSLICKHESYNFLERETDHARWPSSFPDTVSMKSWEMWAKAALDMKWFLSLLFTTANLIHQYRPTRSINQIMLNMNKWGEKKKILCTRMNRGTRLHLRRNVRGERGGPCCRVTSTAACWASDLTRPPTTPLPPPWCWGAGWSLPRGLRRPGSGQPSAGSPVNTQKASFTLQAWFLQPLLDISNGQPILVEVGLYSKLIYSERHGHLIATLSIFHPCEQLSEPWSKSSRPHDAFSTESK